MYVGILDLSGESVLFVNKLYYIRFVMCMKGIGIFFFMGNIKRKF